MWGYVPLTPCVERVFPLFLALDTQNHKGTTLLEHKGPPSLYYYKYNCFFFLFLSKVYAIHAFGPFKTLKFLRGFIL